MSFDITGTIVVPFALTVACESIIAEPPATLIGVLGWTPVESIENEPSSAVVTVFAPNETVIPPPPVISHALVNCASASTQTRPLIRAVVSLPLGVEPLPGVGVVTSFSGPSEDVHAVTRRIPARHFIMMLRGRSRSVPYAGSAALNAVTDVVSADASEW
ncbi:MAG: hypothetical protein QM831_22735 [Kofleriaceae bacterium]